MTTAWGTLRLLEKCFEFPDRVEGGLVLHAGSNENMQFGPVMADQVTRLKGAVCVEGRNL